MQPVTKRVPPVDANEVAQREWSRTWIQPIITAIHNLQMVKARELIDAAHSELAGSGL